MPEALTEKQFEVFMAGLLAEGLTKREIDAALVGIELQGPVSKDADKTLRIVREPKSPEGPVGPSAARGAPLRGVLEAVKSIPGALQVGGQQFIESMGGAAEFIGSSIEEGGKRGFPQSLPGQESVGRFIRKTGEHVAGTTAERLHPLRSEPMKREFWQEMGRNPVRTLTERGLVQIPQVIAVIASGASSLPVQVARGGSAFLLEAGAAHRDAITSGATPQEANQAAGITGLANMVFEMKGADAIFKAIKGPRGEVRRFFSDIGKVMATEGATETVQEFNGKLVSLAVWAGDRGLSVSDLKELFSAESLKAFGAAGVIGMVTGGAVAQGGRALEAGSVPKREDAPPERQDVPRETAEALEVTEAGASPPSTDPLQTETRVVPADPEPTKEVVAEMVGRPELANPSLSPESRSFFDAVLEEQKRENPLDHRRDEEVFAEAEQRLQQNGPQAEFERFVSQGLRSDADVVVARRLYMEAAKQGLGTGNTSDLIRARSLALKYTEDGTAMARTFRMRGDWMLKPDERSRKAVMDAVLMPSETLRKELDEAQTDQERAHAEEKYAIEINEARADVIESGIDLDRLLEEGRVLDAEDIAQLQMANNIVSASKSTLDEKLVEWWRNSILSGLSTIGITGVNVVGNTSYLAYDSLIKQPLKAALQKIPALRSADARGFEEIAATYEGFFSPATQAKAFRQALQAFNTERPVTSDQVGDTEVGTQIIEPLRKGRGPAIRGFKGRVIRLPQRVLLMADEYFKTTIMQMQIYAEARRLSPQIGMSEQELVANPTADMVQVAYDKALELTFQKPLGKIGKSLLAARRRHPILGTFTVPGPFIVTPTNIIKESVKKSPLGIVPLVNRYARHVRNRFSKHPKKGLVFERDQQAEKIAEQVLAWGMVASLAALIGEEGEDPWITGSKDPDLEARETQYRMAPPLSIRVGSKSATEEDLLEGRATKLGEPIPQWISYDRIEPLAFPLILAVDLAYTWRDIQNGRRDWGDVAPAVLQSSLSLVRDKTFLRTLGDLWDAFEMMRYDPENWQDAAWEWGSQFASSWVPKIIQQAGQSTRPFLPDRRPAGKRGTGERLEDTTQVAKEQAFPFGDVAPARHDIWGRPIRLGEFHGPKTDFFYRLMAPFRLSTVAVSDIDRLIVNYNNTHEDEWHPAIPRRYVVRKGKNVYLTRAEYQEMLRRSGQMAHEKLLRHVENFKDSGGVIGLNVDRPGKKDKDLIIKTLKQSRERVLRQMGI